MNTPSTPSVAELLELRLRRGPCSRPAGTPCRSAASRRAPAEPAACARATRSVGGAQGAVRVDRHDEPLLRARCRRRTSRCPSAPPRRPSRAAHELNEPHAGLLAQLAQVAALERLDEDRRLAPVPAVLVERREQLLLERQADAAEIGRDASSPGRCRSSGRSSRPSCCASSITSSNVGTSNWPS